MEKFYPKVSVIMGVNNGEPYINQAIDSILNQTYEDFEFIIVVNCSTDNTLELVKSYQKKDPRIFVYTTRIPQLSFNLNYALNLARGDYIVRIDADDISKRDRIQKQMDILEKMNIDIVGSCIDMIDENGVFIRKHNYPETDKEIRKYIYYRSILSHPAVTYRKQVILDNAAYLGGRTSEDYGLWLRLMRNKSITFYNIQETLLEYRLHLKQTKGNPNSYAEVAGLLLTESIVQKKFIYLFGSFSYLFRAFIMKVGKSK